MQFLKPRPSVHDPISDRAQEVSLELSARFRTATATCRYEYIYIYIHVYIHIKFRSCLFARVGTAITKKSVASFRICFAAEVRRKASHLYFPWSAREHVKRIRVGVASTPKLQIIFGRRPNVHVFAIECTAAINEKYSNIYNITIYIVYSI